MTKKPKDPTEGHTPGPWTVCGPRIEAHDSDGLPFKIAEVYSGTRTTPREDADAALIAQAPALLAENKRLREALDKANRVILTLTGLTAQPESKEAKP